MPKYKPEVSASLGRRSKHKNPKLDAVVTAVQEEDKKRLHAFIPASLHQKLKLRAVTQDSDMTELIIDALEAYLD